MLFIALLLLLTLVVGAKPTRERPSEQERVRLWYEAGNTWPPNWHEESPEKRELLYLREQQIMNLTYGAERWENWLQFTQSRLVPKFTPLGFKVVPIPDAVYHKLMAVVNESLKDFNSIPEEGRVDVIYSEGEKLPKFINMWDVTREAHRELLPLHEEWGGMKLKPTSAYGVRLYRNGSSLVMHYDRVETHVISSIVHLAHEYDSEDEPWPLQIEDHEGRLHAVSLQAGQMLFYESAKCLHGRMTAFKGRFYGSVFMHYQPLDKSLWDFTHDDVIASVPPHWRDGILHEGKGPTYAGACITVPDRRAHGAYAKLGETPEPKSRVAGDELPFLPFLKSNAVQDKNNLKSSQFPSMQSDYCTVIAANKVDRPSTPPAPAAGLSKTQRRALKIFLASWGVFQFLAVLVNTIRRLVPVALEPMTKGGLLPFHWALAVAWLLFMVRSEGYEAFQNKLSPLLVRRAFLLSERPTFLRCLLAGPFVVGLFGATPRRQRTSWFVAVGVAGLVSAVKRLPYPFRAIVDAGVVAGLSYGVAATVVIYVRAFLGHEPSVDPCLPEGESYSGNSGGGPVSSPAARSGGVKTSDKKQK